ncbi:hypothetical protein ABID56_001420 [Alkalibacillus flavidus]|uniref:Uncharacterized protein n=1 Tax=Alkalibacillus flavidus TaxID=546021 RepID=A0ABV2KXB6_9BACI
MHILINLLLYISAFMTVVVMVACIVMLIVGHEPVKKWVVLFVMLVFATGSIFISQQYLFTFDYIERTRLEDVMLPVTSPNNDYVAYAYYNSYGGAAEEKDVFIEVQSLETFERRVVYYSNAQAVFDMNWVDGDELFVLNEQPGYVESRRSTVLDVDDELYYDLNYACQSLILQEEYESCYEAGEEQL